jgi:hypothetical protein
VNLRQRINRLKREITPPEDEPMVVFMSGNPEPTRRLGRSMGGREAMIGGELFEALDGESVKQFHRRLAGIARERVAGLDCRMTIVSVGDDEPQPVCRYDREGTLITVN